MAATTLIDVRNEIIAKIKEETPNPVLYDLGSGPVPQDGFLGIDYHAKGERVTNADLYSFPWFIPDASVDYFLASHFVEHIPDWRGHFEEVYRCLKPGGFYEIISPYYMNNRWFQDPDHKQPILKERFLYLSQGWLKANKIDHCNAKVNFSVVGSFESLNDDFVEQGFAAYDLDFYKRHMWNVVDDLAVILRKEPLEE